VRGVTAATDKVLRQAAPLVVPNDKVLRATQRVADKVFLMVGEASKGHGGVVGVFLGGSFAKDTWLPGDVDIDVFLKISTSVDEKRFEEIGLSVGREALHGYKPGKKYAQHPYTEAVVDGFKVNVVPCYDVKPGEWRSAADRSMHHVLFVRQNLDEGARLQVRLLKRFMKAVGVYGAEIEKEGFSGYAAEVLIHNNKSFAATLSWFAGFAPKSAENYFSLFDPIDESRDLGRAISKETVARMVLAARAFLDRPSLSFFKQVKGSANSRLRDKLLVIMFQHEELSEDTLWGELKRSARQIAKHLREEGFTLARFSAVSDNKRSSAIILMPLLDSLPELEERIGPGVELLGGTKGFVKANRRRSELVWVGEDGRLRALGERRFTSAEEFLGHVLRSGPERIGVSREVGRALKANGRLLRGERLRRETAKKAWLKDGVTQIISDSVGV